MLLAKGVLTYKKERAYTDKNGKPVIVYDIDVKEVDERFPTSLSISAETASQLSLGDEVSLPVTSYVGTRKDGTTFSTYRERTL